jgi:hypothetical protein
MGLPGFGAKCAGFVQDALAAGGIGGHWQAAGAGVKTNLLFFTKAIMEEPKRFTPCIACKGLLAVPPRADLPFVYSVTFSRPFGTSIRQPKYIPGFASWAILNRPCGAPKDSYTPTIKTV